MALWNYCAICGKRIEVGDPCLGVEKKNAETAGDSICFDCVKIENINGLDKTVSITDLLARAEAAEASVRELETSFRTEKCENGPECAELGRARKRAEAAEARCETLEKMVKEYQDTIVPGYRERAEKAEREAKEAQREVTLCRNGWKKAERERDAAVSDLETVMAYGGGNLDTCQFCKNGQCYARGGTKLCIPKWRGQKEE